MNGLVEMEPVTRTRSQEKHSMEVMEAICSRRAIRDYTARPVERGTIMALLSAAVQAPSAMNEQPWAFVVVQDRALLARYSERARALMLERKEMAAMAPRVREMIAAPDFDIFYNAGTLVVICARTGGIGEERAAWDCCLAAQNLMLAACALGLGTCPIGFAWPLLETPEVRRELDLPDEFVPVFPLIVGYPGRPMPPVPPRREPEVLCWR